MRKGRPRKWTEKSMLDAGVEFYLAQGRTPKQLDITGSDGKLPSVSILSAAFLNLTQFQSSILMAVRKAPQPTAVLGRKVYTCLRCDKVDRRLKIDRRVCEVCKQCLREGYGSDFSWMNGMVTMKGWAE